MACGIVEGVGTEHGDEHGFEAIGDAAQGPAMTVPLGAQACVVVRAARIPAQCALCPLMAGVAQILVTRIAHEDGQFVAAAAGDRSDAGAGAQCAIVSGGQGLSGFGEQSGRHEIPCARQGEEDLEVAVLAPGGRGARHGGQLLAAEQLGQALLALAALAVQHPRLFEQEVLAPAIFVSGLPEMIVSGGKPCGRS